MFVLFFYTNIFGYSFVSFFWYEYIRIFVRIVFLFEYIQEKNLTFAPAGPKINVQRKITSILLCQLCFNFLLYHTSKIQHLASNLKLISKIWYECIRTFEYFLIQIFIRIIFVSFFWYEYIRIFVRIAFLIRIYSDIRSYRFLDINIFEYSFVSRIYIRHTLFHNE